MKYRESNQDKQLRNWFSKDYSRLLLRHITLETGELRGINNLDILFNFPITAIAGRNGSGKSTILALACCAYHNNSHGFKHPKRKHTYYTFSDFFVQHTEEVPPQGIEIRYGIAHNKWRKTQSLPSGVGIGYQRRKKKKGGRWNDYAARVPRNVVFLGIERIVPHSERSQSRSYSKAFKDANPEGWENKVKDVVGAILGKSYDRFRRLEHSKYNLPMVQVGDVIYSGFNMGAGENALFDIFSTIYSCQDGSLLVIDEVELGLHAEAQRKFIEKLKDACLEKHAQVICTTHSCEIYDCLPNDARIFVESVNGRTRISESISSEFAFAKMGAQFGQELDVLVEDDVAKTVLLSALPSAIRSRITVKVIGSGSALSRQLAAAYVRGEKRPCLAVFDGDQKGKEGDNLGHAKKMAENFLDDFDQWFRDRIGYLPGETWPEAWLVQKCTDSLNTLAPLVAADIDSLADTLEYGLQAGKHNEFFEISKQLGLDRATCLNLFSNNVCREFNEEFKALEEQIEGKLNEKD